MSSDSRQTLANITKITGSVIAIIGSVITIADSTMLAISQQGYGLTMPGLLLIIVGILMILMQRNASQCSEVDAGTNMSSDSRKRHALGTASVVVGSITTVALGVLIFSQGSGDTYHYLGIILGIWMVFQGAYMRYKACSSQQSEVNA